LLYLIFLTPLRLRKHTKKSNTAKNDSNETVLKPHMTCYYYGDQGGAKPPRESVNGTI
jgi:hypothetical protein